MRLLIILVTLLTVSAPSFSATINVPTDYKTIQLAIDAASNGDTVLVAPGAYAENIDFKGKAIKVASSGGRDLTTILGKPSGDVVTFESGEDNNSILTGFKIMNGFGVRCYKSSPTIINNEITTCLLYGVSCYSFASPYIVNNSIHHNWQGITCSSNCEPVIFENKIYKNDAAPGPDQGGTKGGGIYSDQSCSSLIINNLIYENSVHGGSTLIGKWYPGLGGGVYTAGNDIVCNNTIYGNSANLKDGEGGGIYGESISLIKNTIIWNNKAPIGSEIGGNPNVAYSDVQGGWPGTGNISGNPSFIHELQGDFHLSYNSPCRDSGNSTLVYLPPYDFEGDPRITYNSVDIGADEFSTHLYFTGNPTAGGDIEIRIVDTPMTPVILWVGAGVLDPPAHLKKYGYWFLKPPMIVELHLGMVPTPSGVITILQSLHPSFPDWDIPLQALSGKTLTNLCVIPVKE